MFSVSPGLAGGVGEPALNVTTGTPALVSFTFSVSGSVEPVTVMAPTPDAAPK